MSQVQPALAHQSALPMVLDPRRLNIEVRSRTSRLAWRGQFSPELIEYLMEKVSPESQSYLDPFCGSGTVLYEAAIRNHRALGVEVNPAAWHLAALASVTALRPKIQNDLVRSIRDATAPYSFSAGELWGRQKSPQEILNHITSTSTDPMLALSLAAIVLVGMGNGKELTNEAIARGATQVLDLYKELSGLHPNAKAECRLGDARQTGVASESVDAVITSPPYINVFNYHQHYRPAAELLGWNVLEAARTEIGSNRKNRMNRFLTVTQYCLDMAQLIEEMSRVIRTDGTFTIVLGRTSSVLGCSFRNGELIRRVIDESGSFEIITDAERVFTSRFGEKIFEDIIIAKRLKRSVYNIQSVRSIAKLALEGALDSVPKGNKSALEYAIGNVESVAPSPALDIAIPKHFDRQVAL